MNLSLLFGEGNGTPLQYSCLENPMVRMVIPYHISTNNNESSSCSTH